MMANATHAVLSAKPAAAPRARATVSGARAAVPAGRPAAFGAPARVGRGAGRGALAVRAAVADDKKFARPGAVEVKEGKGGLEMVVLHGQGGAMAEVYLFGGVCTSWKTGGRDVLYVRPDAKFDKSKPISGGIPHCFPQFGPGKMQLHGFARNLDWVLSGTTGGACPSVEMTLTETAATREMWPTAFTARQTITLNADNKLTATLTVTNTDSKPFDFTSSFHTYFAVNNLAEVAVEGLSGLKMLDRMAKPAKEGTASGAVAIKQAVDSVYYNAPAALTLKVGGGKSVGIKAGGWPDAVVWNPWTDMEACYKEFVCVENAAVGKPIVVAPGASWSGSMELTA